MVTTRPAGLLVSLLIPAGSRPAWYHVLAVIGICILLFAGGLGAAVDFAIGNLLGGVAALAVFALGVYLALLLRKSLRKTTRTSPTTTG